MLNIFNRLQIFIIVRWNMIEKKGNMATLKRGKGVKEKPVQNEDGCTAENLNIVVGGALLARVKICLKR